MTCVTSRRPHLDVQLEEQDTLEYVDILPLRAETRHLDKCIVVARLILQGTGPSW